MPIKNHFIKAIPTLMSALFLTTIGAIVGCGNNDTIKEDPAITKTRVDSATKMRSYFEKSQGNYEALSPEDKTELNKLTGSEQHSKEAFSHMVLTK